jgi:hypothetical protein
LRKNVPEETYLAPEAMRSYLLEHPMSRGGRMWCDQVIEGSARGERHCLRLYAEALRWTGGQTNLVVALVQQLGVRDEAELHELIGQGRQLARIRQDATASLEGCREQAIELLSLVLTKRPDWREEVMSRLSPPLLTNGDSP